MADFFRSLRICYVRAAEDAISRYFADARLNERDFDRHSEGLAVGAFAQSLREAAIDFLQNSSGCAPIPNWNRVLSAIPMFFDELQESVEADIKTTFYQVA